jgi:tetratricopeptide (TPR) repeat protein
VPDNVSAAIARALAKQPADRFGTATGFAEALVGDGARRGGGPFRLRRKVALQVAAASLIVIAAIIIGLSQDRSEPTPDLELNRVVVVPLENRTGDTAFALLGNLAADWIAQGLQQIDVIDVVPTVTAINPGPDVAGIAGLSEPSAARPAGEATGAGTVVAGAYYRRGDSLEFQVQVIDAREERMLRAVAPVTGSVSASGTILDSLRRRVVTTVAAVLDYRLMTSTAVSPPPSLEAYRAYLEGHRTFYQPGPQRMREVLEFMYRAVALDSAFADPRFFIVMAHFNLGESAAADSNAQLLVPFRSRFSPYQRAFLDWLIAGLRGDRVQALRAARARGALPDIAVEALRSNRPNEAIEILSDVQDWGALYFQWHTFMEALHMVGDYSSELIQARRAREAFPYRLLMLRNELRALAALGRLDEVDRGIEESLLLPAEESVVGVAVMGEIGAELRAHGFREASLKVAQRALRWLRSRPPEEAATVRHKVGLALNLYLAERWDEAHALFRELAQALPTDATFRGHLGVLAARQGDREEALRISDQLEGMTDPYDFGHDLYWQACIAAQLGDLDRAMTLLRDAYARGRMFTLFLHRDMDLEPLHGYQPFEEFVRPKG